MYFRGKEFLRVYQMGHFTVTKVQKGQVRCVITKLWANTYNASVGRIDDEVTQCEAEAMTVAAMERHGFRAKNLQIRI